MWGQAYFLVRLRALMPMRPWEWVRVLLAVLIPWRGRIPVPLPLRVCVLDCRWRDSSCSPCHLFFFGGRERMYTQTQTRKSANGKNSKTSATKKKKEMKKKKGSNVRRMLVISPFSANSSGKTPKSTTAIIIIKADTAQSLCDSERQDTFAPPFFAGVGDGYENDRRDVCVVSWSLCVWVLSLSPPMACFFRLVLFCVWCFFTFFFFGLSYLFIAQKKLAFFSLVEIRGGGWGVFFLTRNQNSLKKKPQPHFFFRLPIPRGILRQPALGADGGGGCVWGICEPSTQEQMGAPARAKSGTRVAHARHSSKFTRQPNT
jgi:hypothetical protein